MNCKDCKKPLVGRHGREPTGYCRHCFGKVHPMRAIAAQKRERVADLMADHGSVTQVAAIMGVSRQRVSQLWQGVLQEMGE